MKEQVSTFFDEYASIVNKAIAGEHSDVSAMKKCFAEYFVESSPAGIIGGKNDASFEEKIPQGWSFYKNIGITSMDIVSKEIKVIDEFNAMAAIEWSSAYHKNDGQKGLIVFTVTYLLHTKDDFKIFAYITGDEEAVLKEHGLV